MDIDISSLLTDVRKTGMTQAEVAAYIGVSQSVISDVENRKLGQARPSWRLVDGIRRLAQERGVLAGEQVTAQAG